MVYFNINTDLLLQCRELTFNFTNLFMLFLQLQNSVIYSTISASNKFEHAD